MTPHACSRDGDVTAAVFTGRFESADCAELRAHAAGCAVCHELALIAAVLHEDRRQLTSRLRMPAAGQVWWRAAIRARLENEQTAARPLTWLYGAVGAVALGLAVAAAGAWPVLEAGAFMRAPFVHALDLLAIAGGGQGIVVFGVGAGLCLALLSFTVYLVLSDE